MGELLRLLQLLPALLPEGLQLHVHDGREVFVGGLDPLLLGFVLVADRGLERGFLKTDGQIVPKILALMAGALACTLPTIFV